MKQLSGSTLRLNSPAQLSGSTLRLNSICNRGAILLLTLVLLGAGLPSKIDRALAQTPPTLSIAYTTTGNAPVLGGITVGNSGQIYFATVGTATQAPEVIALNSAHTLLWKKTLTASEKVMGGLSVSPDGTSIYFGTDAGNFYGIQTVDGANKFPPFALPAGPLRKIRSSPALNFNTAQTGGQPAVYFHAIDGKLYALNANTGALLWSQNTGNHGGPSGTLDHPDTWSSSPVIASDGRIYVGSANGSVYGFSPSGTKVLEVSLGYPIEATLAISSSGYLYGGTRSSGNFAEDGVSAIRFGINPANYTPANPSAAILWTSPVNDTDDNIGYVASPVIDQSGFVYFARYAHKISKMHPTHIDPTQNGGWQMAEWSAPGKLCQTPAITQSGILLIGSSEGAHGSVERRFCAFDLGDVILQSPLWEVGSGGGQGFGKNIAGCVLIRNISTGRTYFADQNGRLFFFNSGSPLMAGDWPTYQGGSRRTGVIGSWPYTIATLNGFYQYTAGASALGRVNAWGEVVGQADGQWMYPTYSTFGWSAAFWSLNLLTGFGGVSNVNYSVANSINDSGIAVGSQTSGGVVWLPGNVNPLKLTVPAGFNSVVASDIFNTTFVSADMSWDRQIVGYGNRTVNGVVQTEVLVWGPDQNNASVWGEAQSQGTTAGKAVQPFSISEDQRVAGRAKFQQGGPWRGFVTFSSSTFPSGEIGTFGGTESEVRSINFESGAVGWAHNAAGKRRAFWLSNPEGSLQASNELPRLAGTTGSTYNSEARSVNRFGQIVGRIQNDSNAYRAFIFQPWAASQVSDLSLTTLENNSTPAAQGWILSDAVSISHGGIICGFGSKAGVIRGWVLYPKSVE